MVSIYSSFLFCLPLWPAQETTTVYLARSIFVKLDFATLLFQQSQIKTWLCNTLKWKYHAYTIITFSYFHFISFLSLRLVKQYSFEGDFEFFCSHARLLGDSKMRNTGCPKKFARTVHCCFVIKLCFYWVSDKTGNKWSKDIFVQIYN